MAIIYDAATDATYISEDLGDTVPAGGAHTFIAQYIDNGGTTIPLYLRISNTGGSNKITTGLHIDASGDIRTYVDGTGGTAHALSTGTWYSIGVRFNGTSEHTLWVDGVLRQTQTQAPTADSGNQAITIGGTTAEAITGRLAYVKIWEASLSDSEMESEMRCAQPKRLANLFAFYPMLAGASERLRDYTGQASRTLRANGTLTDGDGPPVTWGDGALLVPFAVTGVSITPPQGNLARSTSAPTVATTGIVLGVATASGTDVAGTGRTGDGDLTLSLPTNWQPGQLAILLLYSDQGSGSQPTDWTQATGSPWGSGTPKLQAFYRFLQGGDANPTTTISGSGVNVSHVGAIATFGGVDPTTPIEAVGAASDGTGTPMTAAEITTLTAGAWALGLCGRGDNETTASQTFGGSGTGVSEIFDTGTSSGNDSQVSLYAKTITSPGLTGAGSATTSVTDPWVSVLLAIRAAAPSANIEAASRNLQLTGFAPGLDLGVPVGSSNVQISASAPTVDWTDHHAGAPASAAINLSAIAPTVQSSEHTNVEPAAGALALSTGTPALDSALFPAAIGLTLSPTAPALSMTGHANIAPAAKDAVLSGSAPTVLAVDHISRLPEGNHLALTEYILRDENGAAILDENGDPITTPLDLAPTVVTTAHHFAVAARYLMLVTAAAPALVINVRRDPASVNLALSPTAPTAQRTDHHARATAAAALTFSTVAPTVQSGANFSVQPAAAAAQLSTAAPTADRTDLRDITAAARDVLLTATAPAADRTDHHAGSPASAAIILSTIAPTVQSGANVGIQPAAGSVQLSTAAPAADRTDHHGIAPAASAAVLTATAPTVQRVDDHTAAPGAVTALLSGAAPSVLTGASRNLEIGNGSVSLSPAAPSVGLTAHQECAPSLADLLLSGSAPNIALTEHRIIVPDAGVLALGGATPDVFGDGTFAVTSTGDLVLSAAAPDVAHSENHFAIPDAAVIAMTTFDLAFAIERLPRRTTAGQRSRSDRMPRRPPNVQRDQR